MKIVFTQHAEKRMIERHILKSEVKETILKPDRSGKQGFKNFAMKTEKTDNF